MTKRILIVGPTPPPHYGVAIATRSILDSTLRGQFELHHLDTSDRRISTNFGRLDPVNVWLGIKHVLQFLAFTLFRRPAAVYIPISQGPLAYFRDALFIFTAAALHTKIVLHLRGSFFREFYLRSGPFMQWVIRLSLARATRMIVLGESLRGLFDGLVSRDRIRVVPNGVNPSDFAVADLARRGDAPPHVCFLGNLQQSKGYFYLLQALAKIRGQSHFTCSIAGAWRDDDERAAALAFLNQNDLASVVRFVGPVKGDDKLALLASADVFAFPSCNEGQPWVVLEAMASGLPVVSTAHSTIPDMVSDGVCGFIVPTHDVDTLAQRLHQLLSSPDLRVKMGLASRQRLASHFTKDNFIRRLGEVFEDAISSPPTPNLVGPPPSRPPH